jgi:AbrB family looped-hinge helix DNA binding protein
MEDQKLELRTVRLQERGQITVPARFREELGLEKGDALTIMRLGYYLLISPKELVIPKATEAISRIREEKGLTLEELLAGLEKQRRAIYDERYAKARSSR